MVGRQGPSGFAVPPPLYLKNKRLMSPEEGSDHNSPFLFTKNSSLELFLLPSSLMLRDDVQDPGKVWCGS